MPSIWVTEGFGDAIKTDQSGNIQTSFAAPGNEAVGYNTSGCLWFIDSSDTFYKTDESGNISVSFTLTDLNRRGAGVDADDCIWVGNVANAVEKIDETGTIQQSFSVTNRFDPGGFQSNQSIWGLTNLSIIARIDQTGVIDDSFTAPNADGSNKGLGIDVDECLWHANSAVDSVYKTDKQGNIQTQFSTFNFVEAITTSDEPLQPAAQGPSIWLGGNVDGLTRFDQQGSVTGNVDVDPGSSDNDAGGVAHRSSGSLAFASLDVGLSNSTVISISDARPSDGNITQLFAPSPNVGFGMAVDSSDSIWAVGGEPGPNLIVKYDNNGNPQTSFSGQVRPTGITVQRDGSLWNSDNLDRSIYRLDTVGSVTSVIPTPSFDTRGLGIDDNESLWAADRANDGVYRGQRDGSFSLIFTHNVTTVFGLTTTDEPLGAGGGVVSVTDTALKASVAYSPFQSNEVGIGTVQAVKAAFAYKSQKGQPAKVWFDTTEQWDNAQQLNMAHASDVVSLQAGSDSGYIIPSQQNWEG